jgi:Ca-activated chloride channel homolog
VAMRFKSLISLLFAGLLFSVSSGSNAISQDSQTTIRAEVALVNVIFTAVDRKGQHIKGLKQSDFEIFEDRELQTIEYFGESGKGSAVPLTIALLIDTSASVKDMLEVEKTTAAEFFNEILRPKNDLALIIEFNSEVNLVQDFTQNKKVLISALNSLKAANNTSLYDAVYLAAEEKLKKEIGRKVMVVITDGVDVSSKLKKEDAIEAAQKNDVVIYGIGVQSEETNFGVLKNFTKETGGAFFSPRARLSEIQSAFQSIGQEIQGQYSLGYVSTNKKRDGAFRAIDLRCKVNGARLKVRKGYYAPKSAN